MQFSEVDMDRVKTGMIVCFESDGSFISKRIEAYQRFSGFDVVASKITHVAVSMGGPYIIEATFPKSKTSNLLIDHQGRKLHFLYYRGQAFRDQRRKNMALWAATRCNLDYGWPALLGFYLRALLPIWGSNPLGQKASPFCSYLVGWAFRRIDIDPWPGLASDLITPAHIFASDMFEDYDVRQIPNRKPPADYLIPEGI